MADKELSQITKEVNLLKRKYEKQLKLSKSYEERNDLLKKIQQLEAIKQSPSQMKSFGKTFMKGLRVTGSSLWKVVRKGSANLSKNSPEFRELSKRKQSPSKPFSDLVTKNYFPQTQPIDLDKELVRPIRRIKPLMTKKQMKKLKKKGFRITDKSTNPMNWELP